MVFSQPSVFPTTLLESTLPTIPSSLPQRGKSSTVPASECAHILESARPGFGHSPKLSFLICETGLIKPIIYVWPTHGQPLNCSPYFLSSHTCTAAKFIFLNFPVQKAPAPPRDWKDPIPSPHTQGLHDQLKSCPAVLQQQQGPCRTKQLERVPWCEIGLLLVVI